MSMVNSDVFVIGSDHNGVEAKRRIVAWLKSSYSAIIVDVGPYDDHTRVDYVDYANAVAGAVSNDKRLKGILICGTGVGMSIAANRFDGARASLIHDVFTAKKTREHNDSNILVFGAWTTTPDYMLDILDSWLDEDYAGGRHEKRVERLRHHGDSIVVVPGLFDIVHPGHIALINYAKQIGRVVVALNDDESTKKITGYDPLNDSDTRANVIKNLVSVDEVVIFDGDVGSFVRKINADYVIKGSNFTENYVRLYDDIPSECEVRIYKKDEKYSTDKLRKKVLDV